MTKYLLIFTLLTISFTLGLFTKGIDFTVTESDQIPKINFDVRPLDKYTVENLSSVNILPGKLVIKETLEEQKTYASFLFELEFNPNLEEKTTKRVSGQINFPTDADQPAQAGFPTEPTKKYPIIVMLRGYVDQEIYRTGDGTRNAAAFFAENGFITVAPDFLGYGKSDSEEGDIFETRFQTYTTVLSLIKSLNQIQKWDSKKLFLWGHSNGGNVALIILETTGASYPTTLWAPVSKPFPYSVLYYTDDSNDRGKLIRGELSDFEELYDPDKYSLDLFFEKINAPLQIHQGEIDDAVPIDWSNQLVAKLRDLEKDVTYFTYKDTDHNMRPSWDTVVKRDLEFFKIHLE